MVTTLLLWYSLATYNSHHLIVYEKFNSPQSVQDKVLYVQSRWRELRGDESYLPLLLGQLDHESGGSWDERLENEYGDVGIPQFNQRFNGYLIQNSEFYDYKFQIDEYLRRIQTRLNEGQTIRQAVISHYKPACRFRESAGCTSYWNRVQKSMKNFNLTQP